LGKFGGSKKRVVAIIIFVTGTWVVLAIGVVLAWRLTSQLPPALLVAGCAGVLIPVLGISLYYVDLKRTDNNLETVRKAIDGLAQGELGVTLEVDSEDELAMLGAGVNDLSANLQELMLHIWQQTARSQRFLNVIETELADSGGRRDRRDELLTHLKDAMTALADLRQLVTTYAFYDVCLEDEKPVAAKTERDEKLN